MDESLCGMLLIASPLLNDPNFRRSVVLIISHDEEGAAGLVLDRPLPLDPSQELPAWAELFDPAELFAGGPVEPEMAVGLVEAPVLPPDGWQPVVGAIGPVDLAGEPSDIGGAVRVRVWVGYSGWSPGQLEAEIEEGAWFVVSATPEDVFTSDPPDLWRQVLRRQGGPLATYSTYAPEPLWN